jgi:predicted dehydrogenase
MARKNSTFTRRRFLATAAQAGAALAAPLFIPGATLGKDGAVPANERVALAAIGIGGRGTHDLDCFFQEPVVQFVAIADIRKDRRESVKQRGEKKYGPGVATYRDFREMLPRQDIDAVLIATGDRWHTMASICAAKAGKDIYCEKPCSVSIVESQALADTMRRYGNIYQAGTQRRSIANFLFAADLCHSGKLGKLTAVHANTLHPGTGHDWLPGQPLPPKDEVDWDLWLGPTPWRPYNKAYIDGGWRNHWDFHGGGILEWGAHTVDLCNWAGTNDERLPVLYEPTGINATIPTTWDGTNDAGCVATYADGLKLVMRSTGWMGLGTCAARYEGEDGWVETGDTGRLEFSSGRLRAEQKQFTEAGTSAVSHIKNFLESVKTRKPARSNAEVVARSHIICHAAYIAWQLGRPLKLDPVKVEFIGDEEANRMRSRALRAPWRI